jgi:exopolysaccharide biosynthesis polyprenyl glycosylphosphotransferase
MQQRFYFGFIPILVLTDLTMTIVSLMFAYYLRFETGLFSYVQYHLWEYYLPLVLIQIVVFPIVFAFRGMYRPIRRLSTLDEFQRVLASVSIGTVMAIAAGIFLPPSDFAFSRALLALAWGLAIILIRAARLLAFRLRAALMRRDGHGKLLIIGSGELGQAILQRIEQAPELGYRPAGLASDVDPPGSTPLDGLPVLGNLEEVGKIVREQDIQEVIIAEPSLTHQRILDVISQCEREQVNIRVFPDVFQIISSAVSIDDLGGLPMVSVRDSALRGWKLSLKRAVDLLVTVPLLILIAPLILIIALLIKLTSPEGPVFYVQERVGLDGKHFKVIKFRSMIPDAEKDTGPVWTERGDSRVTRFGRFIRRFSLDELPQFVNVLMGEMSVVGPRPERPHFVEQFSRRVPRYPERHREKAGLTGWAQINGLRGNVSIEERTAYDLWYIENWTLGLDFKIMLLTIVSIFRDRNAY